MAIKRAFVTGGSGMIGSLLVRRLLAQGTDVAVLSRLGANRLRLNDIARDIQWVETDIGDSVGIGKFLTQYRPTVVFHLASTPFNPPTIPLSEHLSVNTLGMAGLVEGLASCPDARVIYTGSAAVYGSVSQAGEDSACVPATWLGATKAAGATLLAAHARMTGMRVMELRLYTPYGPWERPTRLIPSVVLSALDRRPVRTSEGLQRRDFLYVDDLLDAMVAAAALPGSGFEVLNIGSGEGIAIREIVTKVLDLMGNPVKADFGALPTRPDEILEMSANISKAKAILDWRPKIGLEEGLKRTVDWVVANADVCRRLT